MDSFSLSNIILQLFGPYAQTSNLIQNNDANVNKVTNHNYDCYLKGKNMVLFVDKRDINKKLVYPNANIAMHHIKGMLHD